MPDPTSLEPDDQRLSELIREVTLDDMRLESPPPELWNNIEAAIADADQALVEPTAASTDRPRAVDADPGERSPSSPAPSVHHDDSNVVAFRRRTPLLAAAAAAVVAVVGVGAIVSNLGDDTDRIGEVELAYQAGEPGFDPLGSSASATASVETDGDDRRIVLDDTVLTDTTEGFYELWLLRTDESGVTGLVSLGPVDGDGTYTVPDGVDVNEFSVVDISVEPVDGDPTHSGRSVVRGGLDLA